MKKSKLCKWYARMLEVEEWLPTFAAAGRGEEGSWRVSWRVVETRMTRTWSASEFVARRA